jgi:uncharacterized protein YcbX
VLLRIVARDPRCAITALDPDTGRRDFDTLRLILGYRPSARAAYLGVYAVVDQPGTVSVGDPVAVVQYRDFDRVDPPVGFASGVVSGLA